MADRKKEIVVVLGSGRSGTSTAMRLLETAGMATSEEMTPAKAQNPYGGYEDRFIAEIHLDILKELAGNPNLPLDPEWKKAPIVRQSERKLVDHLTQNIDASQTIFGFKDPKTALLLPMWNRVFNMADITPRYVLCVRNPATVCVSFMTNYHHDGPTAELAWLSRNVSALQYTGGDIFILHYEKLFTDQAPELVASLLAHTGLDAHFAGTAGDLVDSVVEQRLDRARWGEYSVKNRWVQKLYAALLDADGADFSKTDIMPTVMDCARAMDEFSGWPLVSRAILKDRNNKIAKLERALQQTARTETKKDAPPAEQSMELEEVAADLRDSTLENNALLQINKKLLHEIEILNQNADARDSDPKPKAGPDKRVAPPPSPEWLEKAILLETSYSFRLGQVLINAVLTPGKATVLMPYHLLVLARDIVTGRGREKTKQALKRAGL